MVRDAGRTDDRRLAPPQAEPEQVALLLRRGLRLCFPSLLVGFCLWSACAPPPGPVPPPTPVAPPAPLASPLPAPRPLIEESLPAPEKPDVVIVNTRQSESEAGQSVFVEGTLHNQGTGPTKSIEVQVKALDEAGQVVAIATALPTPQAIRPGGSTTFVVRFPNDPTVRSFHVVAEFR